MELKWLANFRTGKVGRYLNRTIDYTYLAGLVSVPATQGRAAESVTGGDVKRMLDHLRQAELISEICDEGAKGLSFNLLASPIEPVAKTTNGIQSLGGEMLQVTKADIRRKLQGAEYAVPGTLKCTCVGKGVVRWQLVQIEIALPGRYEVMGLVLAAEHQRLKAEAIRGNAAFVHEIREKLRVPGRFSEQGRRQLNRFQPSNNPCTGIAPC